MSAAPLSVAPAPNLLDAPLALGAPPWKLLGAALTPGFIAPDHTATAFLLHEDATAAAPALTQLFGPVLGGNIYRFSVHCRAGARHWIALDLGDHGAGQSGARAWFDLAAGRPGAVRSRGDGAARLSSHMERLDDGWYRCDLMAQVSVSASTGMYTAQICLADGDGRWDYPGNAAAGVQIWEPAIRHQPFANLLPGGNAMGAPPWVTIHATGLDHRAAPNAAPTAMLLRETATDGEHAIRQHVAHVAGGPTYVLSCHARAEGRNWLRLVMRDADPDGAVAHAWFDLAAGIAGSVGGLDAAGAPPIGVIEPMGGGWYRCTLHAAARRRRPGGILVAQIQLGLDGHVTTYGGNGCSGVRLWRASLRQRVAPAVRTTPGTSEPASVSVPAVPSRTDPEPPTCFDPDDVSDQKLALLGAFLAARPPATHGVRLPTYAVADGARKAAAQVPFGALFARDALRDFAARHAIRVLPTTRRDIAPGRAAFDLANTVLAAEDCDDFCLDFLRTLQPVIGTAELAVRLRDAVFAQHGITMVAQLRLDLAWLRLTDRLAPPDAGTMEATDLSVLHILRKIKTALASRAAKIYIAADEAVLPFGKARINEAVAQDLGMELIWQSDLLRAAERRSLLRWDRILLDFEIARAAPVFVGHSRASFARLVSLEQCARNDAPGARHYIYNVTGVGLGLRTDHGRQSLPDLAVSGPAHAPAPGARATGTAMPAQISDTRSASGN